MPKRRPSRWLVKLTGLVTLTLFRSTPGVLLPGLLAVPASGCCDCSGEFNDVRVNSSTSMSGLDVSGDGCGAAACDASATDGGCYDFKVRLVGVGGCHLAATATDGRQAATDVAVTFDHQTCCGIFYTTGRFDLEPAYASDAVRLTFSGAGSDGGV